MGLGQDVSEFRPKFKVIKLVNISAAYKGERKALKY